MPQMPREAEIRVREAVAGDTGTLVGFNAAMAQETEGKSLDPKTLERGTRAVFDSPEKGFYVVAEVGDRVVGSLLITYEWSDWRNGTVWWIQSVYVRAESRRRGVYRALHSWVHDRARSCPDVRGIRLYVDRNNLTAQQTYASLGMTASHYDLYEIDFVF